MAIVYEYATSAHAFQVRRDCRCGTCGRHGHHTECHQRGPSASSNMVAVRCRNPQFVHASCLINCPATWPLLLVFSSLSLLQRRALKVGIHAVFNPGQIAARPNKVTLRSSHSQKQLCELQWTQTHGVDRRFIGLIAEPLYSVCTLFKCSMVCYSMV